MNLLEEQIELIGDKFKELHPEAHQLICEEEETDESFWIGSAVSKKFPHKFCELVELLEPEFEKIKMNTFIMTSGDYFKREI